MAATTRASLDELLEFANRVREAGGGAVLDALMPARPADPHKCLIAKNLNFECRVTGGWGPDPGHWGMELDDPELAQRIAKAVDLEVDRHHTQVILLPDEIGRVAHDFDHVWDEIVDDVKYHWGDYKWYSENPERQGESMCSDVFPNSFVAYLDEVAPGVDLNDIQEFWPYIDASLKESAEYGFLNEKGELIL